MIKTWILCHLCEFLPNALHRYCRKQCGGICTDCLLGIGIDCKAEAGSKTKGTDHAQAVFAEPFVRVADRADDSSLDVFSSFNKIVDDVIEGIIKHSID